MFSGQFLEYFRTPTFIDISGWNFGFSSKTQYLMFFSISKYALREVGFLLSLVIQKSDLPDRLGKNFFTWPNDPYITTSPYASH